MKNHIIPQTTTLLEALSCINTLAPEPLVLFVVDNNNRMVGTLTDGDSRRALIAGASVNDQAEKVMHRQFNYICLEDASNVSEIHRQKDMRMKLVPILDDGAGVVTPRADAHWVVTEYGAVDLAGLSLQERLRK